MPQVHWQPKLSPYEMEALQRLGRGAGTLLFDTPDEQRFRLNKARAEADTAAVEQETMLRGRRDVRDERESLKRQEVLDQSMVIDRRREDRLDQDAGQKRAILGRELADETSQRKAALQAFWAQAEPAARKDPDLGHFAARTLTAAAQLKGDEQLRYLEEQQRVFTGLLAQKDREGLADELERGLTLGEFATPGWEGRGITGPDGKPKADPQAQGITSAIERLRSGQGDPAAIRESVNAMRLENAREAVAVNKRVTYAAQGAKMRDGLIAGGLAPTHPMVQGLDSLNAFFASGLIEPEKYADKLIELTTGRKVASGDEKDPKAAAWSESVERALKQAESDPSMMGEDGGLDMAKVRARAEAIMALKTGAAPGGPAAMAGGAPAAPGGQQSLRTFDLVPKDQGQYRAQEKLVGDLAQILQTKTMPDGSGATPSKLAAFVQQAGFDPNTIPKNVVERAVKQRGKVETAAESRYRREDSMQYLQERAPAEILDDPEALAEWAAQQGIMLNPDELPTPDTLPGTEQFVPAGDDPWGWKKLIEKSGPSRIPKAKK